MRILTVLFKMISIPLALVALSACSSGNGSAPSTIDPAGKHAVAPGYTDWVQQHWVAYKALNPQLDATNGIPTMPDTTGCSQCHGADLLGGPSKVSCFGASYNGISCHANADHKLGHPTGWGDHLSAIFHGFSSATGVKGNKNLSACGKCHAGTDAAGIIASVSTAPSCLTTSPPDKRYAVSCHFSSPAVTPIGCGSCHGIPTAVSGTGAHSQHLTAVTPQSGQVLCIDCHANATSVTSRIDPTHATLPDPATNYLGDPVVTLQAVFNAEPGPASYASVPGTCSNVSCHGGQNINWSQAGSFDQGKCANCHVSSGQYNSYASGHPATDGTPTLHIFHLNQPYPTNILRNITCTDCHDTVKLAPLHFATLSVPIPTTAYQTLVAGVNYVTPPSLSYGSCTTSCHADNHPGNWFSQ